MFLVLPQGLCTYPPSTPPLPLCLLLEGPSLHSGFSPDATSSEACLTSPSRLLAFWSFSLSDSVIWLFPSLFIICLAELEEGQSPWQIHFIALFPVTPTLEDEGGRRQSGGGH